LEVLRRVATTCHNPVAAPLPHGLARAGDVHSDVLVLSCLGWVGRCCCRRLLQACWVMHQCPCSLSSSTAPTAGLLGFKLVDRVPYGTFTKYFLATPPAGAALPAPGTEEAHAALFTPSSYTRLCLHHKVCRCRQLPQPPPPFPSVVARPAPGAAFLSHFPPSLRVCSPPVARCCSRVGGRLATGLLQKPSLPHLVQQSHPGASLMPVPCFPARQRG
jgi:hypothetical protein